MHLSYYKRPLLSLLVLYICALVFFYTPLPGKNDVSLKIPLKTVTLKGKVVGFPAVKKKSCNVIVKVYEVNGEKTSGYVYARFKDYTPVWHERLELTGTLKKPYSVSLPGNFDWADYLAVKGIFTEMAVKETVKLTPPAWPLRAIASLRADILRTFEQNFDRNLAAIAGGVLLGERGEIDENLYADFQDSGAIHLLVASGGNVGFVTLVVFAFCGLFGIGRRKTAFSALLIAGIYTLVAGADAPLTRAYFMTVCAVSGYFLHRNSGVFQGLILSCFLILLVRPAAVFETGFQMSFLATLAIVICLNNYELPYHWPRWVKFFVQIFMATLSTQLVLLPVFTNIFFKVSFIGLVSNMLLVPLASLLMGLCFAFYLASLLHVGFVLKTLTGLCLLLFKQGIQFFAAWPFASLSMAAWRTGWIISYYAIVFLVFHLPCRTFLRRIWKVLAVIIVLAPTMQYLFFNPPVLWLMNEWNKNAILFRTPDGTRILIGTAIGADKLARAVRKSGFSYVDAVLISEGNATQLKNLQELKKKIKIGRVVLPFTDTWPGEETDISGITVRTEWGQLRNRHQEIWTSRGYSGRRDSVSYQVCRKEECFTTAGNGEFILYNGHLFDNQRNVTQKIDF